MTQQRIRVWFRKGERLRFISHLDVLRHWERAIRRAGLPLAYSQGFTPHPKIAFAAPLPLGFTGEAEVMDVTLTERVAVEEFCRRLAEQTTDDLAVVTVREVPISAPAPQAALAWADYEAEVPVPAGEAQRRVAEFLAAESWSYTDTKRERPRTYDLRRAVAWLQVRPAAGGSVLAMRLQADQELTARPEHLVEALFPGVEARRITRTALVLRDSTPAIDAWRTKGRFE
ncbi:hypothetical protein HRbin29_00974 [bacterium HR29]|nr:hypothetical protein HRbin29_00974 [bacterium HR29]